MPRNVRTGHSAGSRPSFSRFWLALAASALAHGVLLSGPHWDLPRQAWTAFPATAPMTVRIEIPPVDTPGIAVSPAPAMRPSTAASRGQTRPDASVEQSAARKVEPDPELREPAFGATPIVAQPASEGFPLPVAADPHYYSARDLDTYPWPLAPLQLDRLADERGNVRLEILIDETGVVREVNFVEPGRGGGVDGGGLRAMLAATHFMPGRKDGRAVRSRVTLRLDLAAPDGGR